MTITRARQKVTTDNTDANLACQNT